MDRVIRIVIIVSHHTSTWGCSERRTTNRCGNLSWASALASANNSDTCKTPFTRVVSRTDIKPAALSQNNPSHLSFPPEIGHSFFHPQSAFFSTLRLREPKRGKKILQNFLMTTTASAECTAWCLQNKMWFQHSPSLWKACSSLSTTCWKRTRSPFFLTESFWTLMKSTQLLRGSRSSGHENVATTFPRHPLHLAKEGNNNYYPGFSDKSASYNISRAITFDCRLVAQKNILPKEWP